MLARIASGRFPLESSTSLNVLAFTAMQRKGVGRLSKVVSVERPMLRVTMLSSSDTMLSPRMAPKRKRGLSRVSGDDCGVSGVGFLSRKMGNPST